MEFDQAACELTFFLGDDNCKGNSTDSQLGPDSSGEQSDDGGLEGVKDKDTSSSGLSDLDDLYSRLDPEAGLDSSSADNGKIIRRYV